MSLTTEGSDINFSKREIKSYIKNNINEIKQIQSKNILLEDENKFLIQTNSVHYTLNWATKSQV